MSYRIIERTSEYIEAVSNIKGFDITFRRYFENDVVLIELNDNFARLFGYNSVQEIHALFSEFTQYDCMNVANLIPGIVQWNRMLELITIN